MSYLCLCIAPVHEALVLPIIKLTLSLGLLLWLLPPSTKCDLPDFCRPGNFCHSNLIKSLPGEKLSLTHQCKADSVIFSASSPLMLTYVSIIEIFRFSFYFYFVNYPCDLYSSGGYSYVLNMYTYPKKV